MRAHSIKFVEILAIMVGFGLIQQVHGKYKSLFSATSLHPDDVKNWSKSNISLSLCNSASLTDPYLVAILKPFQISLVPTQNDSDWNNPNVTRTGHVQFEKKIPTPISLVPDKWKSGTKNIFKFRNSCKSDRTLFFNAKLPTTDYFVSYYMNRSDFPFRPPSTVNDYFSKTNIEFSTVRVLTLSINSDAKGRNTEVYGLGPKDDATNAARKYNEQIFQFKNAIFLGASSKVPNFVSHQLLDYPKRKKIVSYPMEIYLYFESAECNMPVCALQLVVMVEESSEDNEQIKPIINAVEQKSNRKGLFHEEIKFIKTYNEEGLSEYVEKLYNGGLLDKWLLISNSLDLTQQVQLLRIIYDKKFERVKNVYLQREIAAKNFVERLPSQLSVAKLVPLTTDAKNLLKEIEYAVENIDNAMFFLTKSEQLIVIGNGILETKQSVFDPIFDQWKNAVLTRAQDVTSYINQLIQKINNVSINTTTKFDGTRFDPVKGPDFSMSIPHVTTTYEKFAKALWTYVYYNMGAIVNSKRDLVKTAEDNGLPGQNWDTFLIHYNDMVLTLKQQLSELPEVDSSYYLKRNKYKIQQEARNNVPRIPVTDKFQISWLIPNVSGHYEYTGSLPIPPCNMLQTTVVFDNPIKMSRKQIEILTKVPYGDSTSQVHTTRPLFHDINKMNLSHFASNKLRFTIKYDPKNHQWLGPHDFPDGFHENSIRRAKRKRSGIASTIHQSLYFLSFGMLCSLLYSVVYSMLY